MRAHESTNPTGVARDQRNAEARETVRQRISWPANLTPANVTYHSRGHALLLGSERDTRQAARILQGRGLASLTLVFTAPNAEGVDDGVNDSDLLAATEILTTQALTRAQAEKLRISGHLGMFKTLLDGDEPLDLARALIEREAFDLVLDLNASPCLPVELPPPGYVVMQWQNVEQRNDILDDFVGLVGEFDKPRYFQVNSDLCAHSTSGNIGCTRCLDVCPADAISSIQGRIESHIEIDPFSAKAWAVAPVPVPLALSNFAYRKRAASRIRSLLGWAPTAKRVAKPRCCVLLPMIPKMLSAQRV